MPPILTIISPAITSRAKTSGVYFEELERQVQESGFDVELLMIMDNCRMPIGDKVDKLNHMASGDFIAAVGDDDEPMPNYVEELCKAITAHPDVDVVTFDLDYYSNGVFVSPFTYRLGHKEIAPFTKRRGVPCINRYNKWIMDHPEAPGDVPHQRCAIRREILQSFHYPPGIWYAEDYVMRDWLVDNEKLKTEAHIDKVLYKIYFVSKKPYDTEWKRAQEPKPMYTRKKKS